MEQGGSGQYNITSKRKPVWPLILLMGLLVLFFAGLSTYLWFNPQIEKTETSNISETKPEVNLDNDAMLRRLSVEINQEFDASPAINSTQVSIAAPVVKVEGYDFQVPTLSSRDVTSLWTVVNNDQLQPILDKIAEFMKKEGLTTVKPTEVIPPQGERYFDNSYIGEKAACLVSRTAEGPMVSEETKGIRVGCADMSTYAKAAESAKPFFDLFLASLPEDQREVEGVTISISLDDAKPSKNEGYQTLAGYIYGETGGGNAMFYQTPDKKWHLFKTAQNIVECKSYETDEQKKAYGGKRCMDNENRKLSVVKL